MHQAVQGAAAAGGTAIIPSMGTASAALPRHINAIGALSG